MMMQCWHISYLFLCSFSSFKFLIEMDFFFTHVIWTINSIARGSGQVVRLLICDLRKIEFLRKWIDSFLIELSVLWYNNWVTGSLLPVPFLRLSSESKLRESPVPGMFGSLHSLHLESSMLAHWIHPTLQWWVIRDNNKDINATGFSQNCRPRWVGVL